MHRQQTAVQEKLQSSPLSRHQTRKTPSPATYPQPQLTQPQPQCMIAKWSRPPLCLRPCAAQMVHGRAFAMRFSVQMSSSTSAGSLAAVVSKRSCLHPCPYNQLRYHWHCACCSWHMRCTILFLWCKLALIVPCNVILCYSCGGIYMVRKWYWEIAVRLFRVRGRGSGFCHMHPTES